MFSTTYLSLLSVRVCVCVCEDSAGRVAPTIITGPPSVVVFPALQQGHVPDLRCDALGSPPPAYVLRAHFALSACVDVSFSPKDGYYAWPPCVADADIVLWFFSIFFFHCLFSAVADWMSAIFVTLQCIYRSETCCTRLAEIQDSKNRQKFAICAPSHNFVGLCLRN